MSRLAALAVLLAPAAALAQTQNIRVTTPATGTNTVTLGRDDCNNNRQVVFQWNLTVTPTPGDTVRIFITKDTASCSATSEPTTAPSPPLIQPSTVSPTDQATATARQLLLDLPNGCANPDHNATSPYTVIFCVRRTATSLFGSGLFFGTQQVNFALVAPKAPSPPTVTPGDSHLRLDWTSNDSGDQSYDVYVFPTGTPVDLSKPARNVSAPNVDVDRDSFGSPLQNRQSYDLFVRSIDAYGNHSDLSSPVATGTPVQVDDFYTHYRNEGGSAQGGCATGSGAGVLAAAALAAALWRRRRGTLLALSLLAAAPAARADWTGIDRRPRRWLVAFKMDRYDPQIDSESGLTGTPYHDIFHGRAPPRFQLEVDYQPLHPFGAVLFGFTVGFWQNHGKGLLSSGPSSGQPSQDTVQLRVVPLGVVATYRLDWFADQYRWLPVVPYAQAGLQAASWASLNGIGNVSNPPSGGHGSGWSYGYTTALGVALDVGAIDVALAREAYNETGIQRTCFFAEYGWTRLNDFGKSGALILSDRAWRFGLSLEF